MRVVELFTDAGASLGANLDNAKEEKENFANDMVVIGGRSSYRETGRLIGRIVGLVLSIAIVLFAGKFLWNKAAMNLIPGLKPVKNVFHLLGLMLLIGIIMP